MEGLYDAIVRAIDAPSRAFLKQKVRRSHQSINSFVVHRRLAGLAKSAVEQSGDSSVSVRRSFVDELTNEGQQPPVVRLDVRRPRFGRKLEALDEI